jgi:hypothetical protein
MALMLRLKDMFASGHDRAIGGVEEVLRNDGWSVEREPIVEGVRPDIVARKPGHGTYVVEVKQGEDDANLGSVAQVETFRRTLDAVNEEGETHGILLIAGKQPPNLPLLDEAARNANVTLVTTESSGLDAIRASLASTDVLGSVRVEQHTSPSPHLGAA